MSGERLSVRVGEAEIPRGGTVQLAEDGPLRFVISMAPVDGPGEGPVLTLAGENVPLSSPAPGTWTAEPAWIDDTATIHLVGTCPLELRAAAGEPPVWNACLERRPTRITLDQYQWLLDDLTRRGGLSAVEDPLGRTSLWLELAPHVPTRPQERARIAVALWHRFAPALREIAAAPATALHPEPEWVRVDRLRGIPGRWISARRLRPWDPPLPQDGPVTGTVLVERAEERADLPENRFVLSTASSLASLLEESAADPEAGDETARAARAALGELVDWFSVAEWRRLRPGPFPAQSFLMRDHPAYQAVASLNRLLTDLPGALLTFPPLDRAFPLSPYSLNVLYERWIGVTVVEWVEHRLGRITRPAVPAGGALQWSGSGMQVTVRLDWAYPRRAATGVMSPAGKNRPDVAIEISRPGRRLDLAVIDATYSRQPDLHSAKLGYAATLRDAGARSPLGGGAAHCVRWAAVTYPGSTPGVDERRADLAETVLSVPPGEEGRTLLHRWLDAGVGSVVAGRVD